jgi:hypothetical protein
MSVVSVTVDASEAIAGLGGMQNIAPLTNGLALGAEYLREQEAAYPTQFTHRHTPEWTAKQRRYVMMMIKLGLIVIPRTRTGAEAASWTVQGQGLMFTIGTALGYAPLVKSERMTQFHRITGWESATTTAQRAEPRIFAYFEAGVAQWVGN